MKYLEDFKKARAFLSGYSYRIFRKSREEMEKELESIKSDIDRAMRNQSPQNYNSKKITERLLRLSDYLLRGVIPEEFLEGARSLAVIYYNWAKAAEDKKAMTKAEFVVRFIDQSLTLYELIIVGRQIIEDLRRLRNTRPRSWELSRHYLEKLLEKYKEQ